MTGEAAEAGPVVGEFSSLDGDDFARLPTLFLLLFLEEENLSSFESERAIGLVSMVAFAVIDDSCLVLLFLEVSSPLELVVAGDAEGAMGGIRPFFFVGSITGGGAVTEFFTGETVWAPADDTFFVPGEKDEFPSI